MMEKKGIFARQLVIGLLVLALCAGSVFAAQDYLIPGGYTVGIELEMRGVLVVDVEDGTCAAEAGVQKGDTIIRINGAEAAGAEMLRDAAGEESVVLTVLRDGKEAEFYIAARRRGRLGLLVRDSIAGIGTVTYIDPETGAYGALGTEEKAITENKPFALTGDSFPKIIVRHDIRKRWYDDNGILNISVIDFLLDDTLV